MFHINCVIPTGLEGSRCDTFKLTSMGSLDFAPGWLQFLRDLLVRITLDDVAHLVFAKISQLNSAFESRAHLFYVVLEPAQGGKPAIIDRLTTSQDPCSRRSRDATVGDKTSGHDPFAQLEYLFHLGV